MPEDFGVYVHIPFCARRCDYCDFATWSDLGHLVDAYVEACVTDLRRRQIGGGVRPATSVCVGGGTPSLLEADQLTRILGVIVRRPGAEVTVECNPDSVDLDKLTAYRRAGVNRISFGVQSTVPHVLARLGRTHDVANVERVMTWAREAGIASISVDLLYGADSESVSDWRRSVEEVLALDPAHVSAYALTVESGTPLGRRVAAGEIPAPDDDDQAAKYELADDLLRRAGMEWYELSNFARPGHESRHNLLYWSSGEYLGIGCAAHGHRRGRRWWNVRSPDRYVAAVEAGRSPEAGAEVLDASTRADEALMLGLRTRRGVAAPAGPAASATARLVTSGHLERFDGRVRLSRAGRLVASAVTAELLDSVPPTASRWQSVESSAK